MHWIRGSLQALRVQFQSAVLSSRDPRVVEGQLARFRRFAAYATPAAAAFMAVQSWFVPGRFIASGDIPPFVRTAVIEELGSLWGHQITGAGGPSFEIARLPEVVVLKVVEGLGGSGAAAQHLFYAGLMVWLAMSVVYLCFGLGLGHVAASVAGALAVFNPFIMQMAPNPLPTWTIAFMASAGGVLIRVGRGQRKSPVSLALMSMLAAFIVINPPLLVVASAGVLMIGLVGGALFGRRGLIREVTFLLRSMPLTIMFNLWWIVPVIFTLTKSGAAPTLAAETDVVSWQWTHARNSLPNVISTSSHWAWSYPHDFPYASRLDQSPWGWFRFALPALALLAPVLGSRRYRWLSLSSIALVIVLVLVGKGLHPPMASVNLFLYEHVPGMWLLREPVSKIGALLIVLYVLCAAVTVAGVRSRLEKRNRSSLSQVVVGLVGSLVLLALAYPRPLFTGEVIPAERPRLPPAHVQIPSGWGDVSSFINQSAVDGRVLVLPINDYYQMPTTWGYYGIDVIPRWLLRRPTVQLLPETYFADAPEFARKAYELQDALISKDEVGASRLLEQLGISHVLLRKDIDIDFRSTITSPKGIEAGLSDSSSLELMFSDEVANVYEIGRVAGLVRAEPQGWLPLDPIVKRWNRTGSSEYEISLRAIDREVVIVVGESFAPGWELTGLSQGRVLEHKAVDGYANAWRIAPGPQAELVARYGYESWGFIAQILSVLALAAAFVIWLVNRGLAVELDDEGFKTGQPVPPDTRLAARGIAAGSARLSRRHVPCGGGLRSGMDQSSAYEGDGGRL
jgi:arabinofuranan 3-O-arabinosyltransferase